MRSVLVERAHGDEQARFPGQVRDDVGPAQFVQRQPFRRDDACGSVRFLCVHPFASPWGGALTERAVPAAVRQARMRLAVRSAVHRAGTILTGFASRGPMRWLAAYSATLAVLIWARTLRSAFLVAAAVAIAVAAWTTWRARPRRVPRERTFKAGATAVPGSRARAPWYVAGVACLTVAVAVGAWTERRLSEVATNWDS